MQGKLLLPTVLTVALMGAGCGGSGASTPATAVAETQHGEEAMFVRGCDSRVGDGRLSVTRNDLTLGNARLYAAEQHAPVRMGGVFGSGKQMAGKWRAFKTLVVLNGAEATLRVPRSARKSFLLAYDPAHVRPFAYSRSDGRAAVRFANCTPPRRNLEFAGALLARLPGCYPIQEVSKDGAVVATAVVNIAMGRGACVGHSRLDPTPRYDRPQVVTCEDAIIGSGPPDWRSQSSRAGPIAVGDRPLRQMSPYGARAPGWLISKMMALVAGHRTVALSVPPRLRHRVFLYYGSHPGPDGKRSNSFYDYPGDSAIEFEPCREKPRTVWPGGIRVRGRQPVQLLVTVEGDAKAAALHLGRPKIASSQPRRPRSAGR